MLMTDVFDGATPVALPHNTEVIDEGVVLSTLIPTSACILRRTGNCNTQLPEYMQCSSKVGVFIYLEREIKGENPEPRHFFPWLSPFLILLY